MRRSLIAVAALAFAVTALVAYAAIPDTVTIDEAMSKKSAVTFPHAKHLEVGPCSTCHHTQENLTADNAAEAQKCSACHLDPEQPETPSMREMSMSKNPFHEKCIGCHKAESKGPTKCNDCHPKE